MGKEEKGGSGLRKKRMEDEEEGKEGEGRDRGEEKVRRG